MTYYDEYYIIGGYEVLRNRQLPTGIADTTSIVNCLIMKKSRSSIEPDESITNITST